VATQVMVQVLGFSDVERHSLNTLFRLSSRHIPSYHLWTPESASTPHVALIDVDSYEAMLEIESPNFSPHRKVIAIGAQPLESAWRHMPRPVDWVGLVRELDSLFAAMTEVDIDIGLGVTPDRVVPPGMTVSLVVGLTQDERMYLRARLALAGHTEMDEAESAAQASQLLGQRHYDLMIIGLSLSDADPWGLVQALKDTPMPPRSVVLATAEPTWAVMERADQLGCVGILEIPFIPRQVLGILSKI
jgi:CheY-like chemotaxis protein